jgi:hypothetical protein
VTQVEYVKQEAKLVYLLECLQKTAPPVLIFAENKADVDDIHEYLLKQNVEAVAIHGGKEQEERNLAIDGFKAGKKARSHEPIGSEYQTPDAASSPACNPMRNHAGFCESVRSRS